MRTIEGLEIDYLRKELRKAKDNEELLVEEIFQWIMANEGMGIGECADALYEAHNIVQSWKAKCK